MAAIAVLQCRRIITFSRVFTPKLLKAALSFHSFRNIFENRTFIKPKFTASFSQSPKILAEHEDRRDLVNFVHPQDRTIFVGKLHPSSTVQSVEDYFSQFGVVEKVYLKVSAKKYTALPCAFVQFNDVSSLKKVLSQKHVIDTRNVNVVKCKNFQSRKICVGNVPLELNESQLKDHFSQVGAVDGVEFVCSNPFVPRESYCFVEFKTSSAVLRALESPQQQIGKYVVDVKTCTARNRSYIKGKAIIDVVPDTLTVEVLKDYFSKFGDLTFVDLVFHHGKNRQRDLAFLGFSDDNSVENIAGKNGRHIINDQEIVVRRASSHYKTQDRELKVFVDKIPSTVTEEQISHYFKAFGNATLVTKQSSEKDLRRCIVMFRTVTEVDRVTGHPTHALGGENIVIKRIGWTAQSKDSQLKELLAIL